jgi:hypothetical protein
MLLTGLSGHAEPVVNSFGGVLFPAGETSIELRTLSIVLEQRGEQMQVLADYGFYNPEFERDQTIGFITLPYIPADRQLGTRLAPNFEGLRAEVNGKPIGFDVKPISDTEFQRQLKEITELSYVYFASSRFRRGENVVRVSFTFKPCKDGTGVHGQIYYPYTLTPAGLWANRRIGSFALKIKMEEGTLFTVPRDLGSSAESDAWRIIGQGKTSRSDLTDSSDDELLYVYLKNGFLELVGEDFTLKRDLMIQIYKPLDHIEPLKSMYWRAYNGKGLEQYTQEDLRVARNTMFAFHGCKFESRDLLEHFSRYFWYDPDPDIPNSSEILTGEEQTLLRYIMGQESLPGHETGSLNLFLEQFRRTVIGHDWRNVVEYLDPAYVQDRLYDELGGDRNRFLSEVFGGIDPQRITDLGYDNFPESLASDKAVAKLGVTITASGVQNNLEYRILRSGNTFLLVGPHDGVTNYRHKVVPVRGAHAISVKMRSIGDSYLRCYSTWIEDLSGGYVNLDGADCDPEEWMASHCSCPTAAGSKEVRYDLARYTDTPYTGEVVVAVSSYVGYWRVEVTADTEAPRSVARWQSGRPWSTPADSTQRHAEVKDIRYIIEDGILRGEASFLAWSRTECPACIQQIVQISDRKTGGLYDAVCVDMGIPGLFPGKELRGAFEIRYPEPDTKIWAFPALQYNCEDAISLARQNFLRYKAENQPIIGD